VLGILHDALAAIGLLKRRLKMTSPQVKLAIGWVDPPSAASAVIGKGTRVLDLKFRVRKEWRKDPAQPRPDRTEPVVGIAIHLQPTITPVTFGPKSPLITDENGEIEVTVEAVSEHLEAAPTAIKAWFEIDDEEASGYCEELSPVYPINKRLRG